MNHSVRSTAMTFAVAIFFVMGIAGWIAGQAPATCCSRAVTGAVIAYIIASIAGKTIVSIIVNQIIDAKLNKTEK